MPPILALCAAIATFTWSLTWFVLLLSYGMHNDAQRIAAVVAGSTAAMLGGVIHHVWTTRL